MSSDAFYIVTVEGDTARAAVGPSRRAFMNPVQVRMGLELMTGEDEARRVLKWYVAALGAAAEAIRDGEDVGRVIRELVDRLNDAEARKVLVVMIGHHAQSAVKKASGSGTDA